MDDTVGSSVSWPDKQKLDPTQTERRQAHEVATGILIAGTGEIRTISKLAAISKDLQSPSIVASGD